MADGNHPLEEAGRDSSGSRPGDRIGPYRVEGPLGRGGMGEVVLAYDERLDRRVAIKRIRHDKDTTDADRERLRREARAVASLSHPAIVRIYDILSEGENDAIVMELVEGVSVAQRLEDGPLPLPDALRIARQVAEGLAEAHRNGLAHRDLKAENVMVTPPSGSHPGRAKILDFGLAKVLPRLPSEGVPLGRPEDQTLTRKGAVMGTARAMSPEQARGLEIDHRSDLFSFGVFLYEMLTGDSPFRGTNEVDTMRRLVIEDPRPIRELRPAVPAELEALITQLLEKRPEDRPGSTDEVARALGELSDWRPTGADPTLTGSMLETLSDVPTGLFRNGATEGPTKDPAKGDKPGKLRRRLWLAAAAGSILLALVGGTLLYGGAQRAEPLRVVVPRPEIRIQEPTEDLELAASGVLVSSLSALASLEGIAPVEPGGMNDPSHSAMDTARSVAADEVLGATIEPQGGNVRITLRRIRGTDGEVLWVSSLTVPNSRSSARILAEAVTVQLQRAYPERSVRQGVAKQDFSDEDYAAFIEIIRRLESGDVAWEPELERLEAISQRAPTFVTAHLQGAATAWSLHSDTRDPGYLDRGEKLVARAREVAPQDPRTLFWTFRIALERGKREAAEAALASLMEVAPNDINIPMGRSHLAERDGDLGAAAEAMASVVERAPSWQNLHRLAELQLRRGKVDDARRSLEQLIALVPANTWGLAKLARLELFYGDLERAATLYQQCIELKPHRSYFTNLGLARFMLGRYGEAKESYLRALEIQPDHLYVRLNLADTEMALGDSESALARYRSILEELEEKELNATERMTMAQCLVHLGERQRAVSVTLDTLQRHPEDLQIVYMAALVYAIAGDVESALVNTEKALAQGYQRRWFTIPDFDVLRSDPRFMALLEDRPDAGATAP